MMNKYQIRELAVHVFIICLCFAAGIGWCLNIYKLATMGFDQVGLLVVRIAGIFIAPLGAFIGWI